jgi:hypothetical protein
MIFLGLDHFIGHHAQRFVPSNALSFIRAFFLEDTIELVRKKNIEQQISNFEG